MGQLPNPYFVDEPRVLERLLSPHLPVGVDEIPEELPKMVRDLLVKDLDLDAPTEERNLEVHKKGPA